MDGKAEAFSSITCNLHRGPRQIKKYLETADSVGNRESLGSEKMQVLTLVQAHVWPWKGDGGWNGVITVIS